MTNNRQQELKEVAKGKHVTEAAINIGSVEQASTDGKQDTMERFNHCMREDIVRICLLNRTMKSLGIGRKKQRKKKIVPKPYKTLKAALCQSG